MDLELSPLEAFFKFSTSNSFSTINFPTFASHTTLEDKAFLSVCLTGNNMSAFLWTSNNIHVRRKVLGKMKSLKWTKEIKICSRHIIILRDRKCIGTHFRVNRWKMSNKSESYVKYSTGTIICQVSHVIYGPLLD